jgi:hypothetical protein
MVVHYRFVKGQWQVLVRRYEPLACLDLRGESYFIVPGTVDD